MCCASKRMVALAGVAMVVLVLGVAELPADNMTCASGVPVRTAPRKHQRRALLQVTTDVSKRIGDRDCLVGDTFRWYTFGGQYYIGVIKSINDDDTVYVDWKDGDMTKRKLPMHQVKPTCRAATQEEDPGEATQKPSVENGSSEATPEPSVEDGTSVGDEMYSYKRGADGQDECPEMWERVATQIECEEHATRALGYKHFRRTDCFAMQTAGCMDTGHGIFFNNCTSNKTSSTLAPVCRKRSSDTKQLSEYVEGKKGDPSCPEEVFGHWGNRIGMRDYARLMNVSECEQVARDGKFREAAAFWVAKGCFDDYHVTAGCFAMGPSVFFHEVSCNGSAKSTGSHIRYICKIQPPELSDATLDDNADKDSSEETNATIPPNVSEPGAADALFNIMDKNHDGQISIKEMRNLS